MANPRQRRKARSRSTLKPSLNAKRGMKKKLVRAPTVHGADVLKDNYDPKLTLKQNYARLGLVASLDVRPDTGGVERRIDTGVGSASSSTGPAAGETVATVKKGMARVVRDDAGNIVDIVEAESDSQESTTTPWGRQMSTSIADAASQDIETFMPPQQARATRTHPVVDKLEEMAANAHPVQRHTSKLESQWLRDLVAKYNDDVESMAKDRTLNVWQKTVGEINRAIKKAGGFNTLRS